MSDIAAKTEDFKRVDVFEGYDPEVKIRTKKMMMYLIIFAIVMIFGGFTAAYVYESLTADFWIHISPPPAFWVSNLILLISSGLLIWSVQAAKKNQHQLVLGLLVTTFLAGLAFTWSQWEGMLQLGDGGIYLRGNFEDLNMETMTYGEDFYIAYQQEPMVLQDGEFYAAGDEYREKPLTAKANRFANKVGSYIWALVWVHVIHLLLGLIYLIVNAVRAAKKKFNAENNISLRVQGMYWHFLGILWVYLFVFLFYIH